MLGGAGIRFVFVFLGDIRWLVEVLFKGLGFIVSNVFEPDISSCPMERDLIF